MMSPIPARASDVGTKIRIVNIIGIAAMNIPVTYARLTNLNPLSPPEKTQVILPQNKEHRNICD